MEFWHGAIIGLCIALAVFFIAVLTERSEKK